MLTNEPGNMYVWGEGVWGEGAWGGLSLVEATVVPAPIVLRTGTALDLSGVRTVKVRVRKITGGNAGLRTVTCTVTVTPYTDGMQAGRTSGV